jgi:hypothetical protein
MNKNEVKREMPSNKYKKGNFHNVPQNISRKSKKMDSFAGWDPDRAGSPFSLEDIPGDENYLEAPATGLQNRGNRSMGQAISTSDYWLSSNMKEIIDCPYQPGNLKISKNACLKRHEASSKTTPETINQANLFLYTVGSGLLRCKTCSIVERLL